MMLSQTNLNCLDVEWVEFQSESNPTLSHNPSTLCTSKRMSDDHLRNLPTHIMLMCSWWDKTMHYHKAVFMLFQHRLNCWSDSCFSLASRTCCTFTAINLLSNQSNGLQCPMTLEWWTTLFNRNGMAENCSFCLLCFLKRGLHLKISRHGLEIFLGRGRQFVVRAVGFDWC